MAGLRTQQLSAKPPISVEGSPPLPSMSIHLGRTKTSPADSDEVVYLNCRPVDALSAWLKAAKIDKGLNLSQVLRPVVFRGARRKTTGASSVTPIGEMESIRGGCLTGTTIVPARFGSNWSSE
jgi:hypothetical protein